MPDILSLGESMVEFFAEEPLSQAEQLQKAFAGDALNLLAAASRLGSSTGFLSRIGNDPFQEFLLNGWESLGYRYVAREAGGGAEWHLLHLHLRPR